MYFILSTQHTLLYFTVNLRGDLSSFFFLRKFKGRLDERENGHLFFIPRTFHTIYQVIHD